MSIEQTLIFIVFFGIALLQALGRALKSRQAAEAERAATAERDDTAPPPPPPEPEEFPWHHAFAEPDVPVVVAPRILVPQAPPKPVPPPPRREAQREPPRRTERHTAAVLRPILRNEPALRRAIALMTVLGPPRALDPYKLRSPD